MDDAIFLHAQGGGMMIDLGTAAGGAAGVDTLTLVGVTDLRASDFVIA